MDIETHVPMYLCMHVHIIILIIIIIVVMIIIIMYANATKYLSTPADLSGNGFLRNDPVQDRIP